uniref:Late endosomal/lysosomal adaptor and MAPK and MTOR activator 5 n=1 Tax=Crassostrea virginica TaxID=6565 RepID=A0A8B8BFB7_CRAVI|nr:ragulator complex protein LAMTOR5 homolog [Crassostrea virginica]
MERQLEKHLEETCRVPGISGALCADNNGLCLAARGCKPELAGHVASIAQQAGQLHPNASTTPVICIESEGGSVLIKSENDVTMAMFKTPL